MVPHDRDAIRRRLASLFRLAERAATEHEALAAAAAAARLMAAHGLTYTSAAETEAETFVADSRPWFTGRGPGRRRAGRVPAVRYALPGISALCGVEAAWSADGSLLFFGVAHEVEAAHYFVDLISRAITTELAAYEARTPRPRDRAAARAAFRKVMALRIGQRLETMAAEERGTGTGLVVVKDALVKKRFAEQFRPRTAGGSASIRDTGAALAGYHAANRTSLARGVATTTPVHAITHSTEADAS